jgi:hypothetical protein
MERCVDRKTRGRGQAQLEAVRASMCGPGFVNLPGRFLLPARGGRCGRQWAMSRDRCSATAVRVRTLRAFMLPGVPVGISLLTGASGAVPTCRRLSSERSCVINKSKSHGPVDFPVSSGTIPRHGPSILWNIGREWLSHIIGIVDRRGHRRQIPPALSHMGMTRLRRVVNVQRTVLPSFLIRS